MRQKNMQAQPAVIPLYSLSLGALSCLLFYTSAMLQTLQYDRAAISQGELWRLITGHFTHWNFEHFLWNVAVFCGLGIVSELYDRKGYLICLITSSLLIPLMLWWLAPNLATYRGLSGVASGLFLFVALRILGDKIRYRQWPAAGAAVIYMTGFFGKIIYETMSGATVFAAASGIYEPVPLAHLVGGIVGAGAAMVSEK